MPNRIFYRKFSTCHYTWRVCRYVYIYIFFFSPKYLYYCKSIPVLRAVRFLCLLSIRCTGSSHFASIIRAHGIRSNVFTKLLTISIFLKIWPVQNSIPELRVAGRHHLPPTQCNDSYKGILQVGIYIIITYEIRSRLYYIRYKSSNVLVSKSHTHTRPTIAMD